MPAQRLVFLRQAGQQQQITLYVAQAQAVGQLSEGNLPAGRPGRAGTVGSRIGLDRRLGPPAQEGNGRCRSRRLTAVLLDEVGQAEGKHRRPG